MFTGQTILTKDQFLKITIAQLPKIVVTRKKSNATLNLKLKTMDGLVQRTIGVLCCTLTYHYFIGCEGCLVVGCDHGPQAEVAQGVGHGPLVER